MHTNYHTKDTILTIFQTYSGPFNVVLIQHYYSPLTTHQLQAILDQLVADGSITAIENGYYRLAN